MRLLTLHNLTFMAQLMRRLRAAIEAGEYEKRPKSCSKRALSTP